jgi:hypothetical protein
VSYTLNIWVKPALALNFGLEEYYPAIFTRNLYDTLMLGCSKNQKSIFLLLSIEIQLTIPKIGILAEKEPTKARKLRFLPKYLYDTLMLGCSKKPKSIFLL